MQDHVCVFERFDWFCIPWRKLTLVVVAVGSGLIVLLVFKMRSEQTKPEILYVVYVIIHSELISCKAVMW